MTESGFAGETLYLCGTDALFRQAAEHQISKRIGSDSSEISAFRTKAPQIDGNVDRVSTGECKPGFVIIINAVITHTGNFHSSDSSFIRLIAASAAAEGLSI